MNAVLMSSANIKHICFLETKPEINHFWPFLLKVGNLPRSTLPLQE